MVKEKKIYSEIIESDAYQVCKEVRTILDRLQMTSCVDTEQCFDIKVILNELLQNAIRHGNGSGSGKKNRVDVWLQDNSKVLGITVRDQGNGFNAAKIMEMKAAKASIDDPMNMDESGRGLFIVQNLCDGIVFNHLGNEVTVHKRL